MWQLFQLSDTTREALHRLNHLPDVPIIVTSVRSSGTGGPYPQYPTAMLSPQVQSHTHWETRLHPHQQQHAYAQSPLAQMPSTSAAAGSEPPRHSVINVS